VINSIRAELLRRPVRMLVVGCGGYYRLPAGENLAAMVMPGVKATPEEIIKSLEGNRREELWFMLRQHWSSIDLSGENDRLRPAVAETPGVVGGPK
jgi:hypothetical protein